MVLIGIDPGSNTGAALYRDGELRGSHLIDTNSGNAKRGICSLPYVRRSDGEVVYFPTNLIDNLFLSNGMSAGNTLAEALRSARILGQALAVFLRGQMHDDTD